MNRVLSLLVSISFLGVTGCATRMFVDDGTFEHRLQVLPDPVAANPKEPSFCLVSILASWVGSDGPDRVIPERVQRRKMSPAGAGYRGVYEAVKSFEPFRDFRVLGLDAADPEGCDLFVKLAVSPYADGAGTRLERAHVYSAYSKSRLWSVWAGGQSPILDLARRLHADFQPGTPGYELMLKNAEGREPLTAADVLAWSGPEMRPMTDYIPGYVAPPPSKKIPKPAPADSAATSSEAVPWWKK